MVKTVDKFTIIMILIRFLSTTMIVKSVCLYVYLLFGVTLSLAVYGAATCKMLLKFGKELLRILGLYVVTFICKCVIHDEKRICN